MTWLREQENALKSIKQERLPENAKSTADAKRPVPEELLAEITLAMANELNHEKFMELSKKVLEALSDEQDEADHSLANLALLDNPTNSALSNSVFEVKRQKVLEKDKKDEYIPIGTRNVFLKYYTPSEGLQPHFWSKSDKKAYLEAIKEKLKPILEPSDNE